MIYHNVLVPYDKSSHAKHALETAVKLISDDPTATLTIFYVTESPENEDATFAAAARMAGVTQVETEADHELEKEYRDAKRDSVKKDVAPIIAGAPNEIEYKIATGRPQHAILNFVYDHECDLIVMGCRGLNALQGMLGSVSYAVLRSSEVPVFIIK